MVQHKPLRKWLIAGFFVVLSVLCLLIGYAMGHNRIIERQARLLSTEMNYEDLQARLHAAESELVESRLTADVAMTAADSLRTELADLHSQVGTLNEEVAFYKSLMAPGDLQRGLKIDALEMVALEQGVRFELLLTQVAQRRTYISGEVRVDIVGTDDSGQVVKSLTDLAPDLDYPMKFRFRYFQDLRGLMVLPEGFTPQEVLVTAQQRGKPALQASFPWPSLATPSLDTSS